MSLVISAVLRFGRAHWMVWHVEHTDGVRAELGYRLRPGCFCTHFVWRIGGVGDGREVAA